MRAGWPLPHAEGMAKPRPQPVVLVETVSDPAAAATLSRWGEHLARLGGTGGRSPAVAPAAPRGGSVPDLSRRRPRGGTMP